MADVRDKLFEAAWAGWKDNHNLVTICDAILADKPLCKEIGDSAVEKPKRYETVGNDRDCVEDAEWDAAKLRGEGRPASELVEEDITARKPDDALRDARDLVEPLKKACDRRWENETPEMVVAIAANAIHWRDACVRSLEAQLKVSESQAATEQRGRVEAEKQLAEIGDYLEVHEIERFGDTPMQQVRRTIGERDDSDERLAKERSKVAALLEALRAIHRIALRNGDVAALASSAMRLVQEIAKEAIQEGA